MGKPEGIIENYLQAQSELHNFLCLKFISPSYSGVPDRILLGIDGNKQSRVIFVETKSETGSVRELQNYVIQNMKFHGADVRIINTKEKVNELFKELMSVSSVD